MQSNETTTSAMGEEGEKGKAAEEGMLKKCGALRKNTYTIPEILLGKRKDFNDY